MSLVKTPPNGKPMLGNNVTNTKVVKVNVPQQTTKTTVIPARTKQAETGSKD